MFRFAHPIYLYLLAVLPVMIGGYVYTLIDRRRAVRRFGDPKLVPSSCRKCRVSAST